MQLRKFVTDQRAVSPVIGIILMVAITVILASVLAVFVLGIGNQQSEVPTVDWEFDYTANDKLKISHQGGNRLRPSNTGVTGKCSTSGNSGIEIKYVPEGSSSPTRTCWPVPVSSGDTRIIDPKQGTDVIIRWQSAKSERTNVLAEFEVGIDS